MLFSGGRTSIYGLRVTLSDNLINDKKEHDSAGVETAQSDDTNIWCDGRNLHLFGFNGGNARIYDLNGSLVKSQSIIDSNEVVDLQLNKGLYIVQAVSLQGVETRKIVIE